MSESSQVHQQHARQQAARTPVRCAILTISDTRTPQTDTSGALIERLLTEGGYAVAERVIVRDEPAQIADQVRRWLGDATINALLTNGGTGVARRDGTIDTIRPMLTIELEGFGELFRMLSYEQVKGAAMMSRAIGGLVLHADERATFIFCMPGSNNAVETAMKHLIVPQLDHLVWERRR